MPPRYEPVYAETKNNQRQRAWDQNLALFIPERSRSRCGVPGWLSFREMRWRRTPLSYLDRRNKAVAPARDGLDVARRIAVVVKHGPDLPDTSVYAGVEF